MEKLIYNRNCVFQAYYHVVWCAKYRKQILVGEVANHVKYLIYEICEENDWPVKTTEIQPDHIHVRRR